MCTKEYSKLINIEKTPCYLNIYIGISTAIIPSRYRTKIKALFECVLPDQPQIWSENRPHSERRICQVALAP